MRGKHGQWNWRYPLSGTIPAYAGKTFFDLLFVLFHCELSPRMRGKPSPRMSLSDVVSELAPRMRGKLLSPTSIVRTSRNYPRVCGENLAVHPAHKPYPGTIPAYAGKTERLIANTLFHFELSPRMRGKHRFRFPSLHSEPNYPRVCGETLGIWQFWMNC